MGAALRPSRPVSYTHLQDAIAFNTNGNTPHTLTLDVKKGTMLYLVGYTTGANRDGWIFNYRVKYLSVNSEEEAQPSLPADGVEGSAKDWNKTLADYTALQAMTCLLYTSRCV